jgi:hypothetical protein
MNDTRQYTSYSYGIETLWAKKTGRRDERINSVLEFQKGNKVPKPSKKEHIEEDIIDE